MMVSKNSSILFSFIPSNYHWQKKKITISFSILTLPYNEDVGHFATNSNNDNRK